MSEKNLFVNERRRLLKMLGYGVAAVPLAGLAACSAEKAPVPAKPGAEAAPKPKAAAVPPPKPLAEAPAATELVTLTEDDPQAKALAYVQDAATVDAEKYLRYESGQACANCALFLGGDAEQGGCSIFPGKAVKATGWCSVYAPQA